MVGHKTQLFSSKVQHLQWTIGKIKPKPKPNNYTKQFGKSIVDRTINNLEGHDSPTRCHEELVFRECQKELVFKGECHDHLATWVSFHYLKLSNLKPSIFKSLENTSQLTWWCPLFPTPFKGNNVDRLGVFLN